MLVVSPAVGTPTGSVHLFAGEKPVGEPVEVSADGETLVLSSSTLPVGLNHLTARYTGDDRFVPAISNPVEHVVNPGDTEVALTSSAPDTELGEEVINRMIAEGKIIARPAQEDEVAMKLLRTLSIVSRRRWPEWADKCPSIGVPPPKKKADGSAPAAH